MTGRCLNARDPITGCRPLGVEVWKIDKAVLVDWMPAQSLPYKGAHGMSSRFLCGKTSRQRAQTPARRRE